MIPISILFLSLFSIASISADSSNYLDNDCNPHTIGYWKQPCKEHFQHETIESMLSYLDVVNDSSDIFSSISNFDELCQILDPSEPASMEQRAKQQSMALWFNVVSRKLFLSTQIDLGSLSNATTVEEALTEIEDLINSGEDLERAKDMADYLNNGNGIVQCEVFCPEDCDSYDDWYDTGNITWIDENQCREKEQKEQEYRDYYCNTECQYNITEHQWIDTNNTRNKQDGTFCDDGLWCTIEDQCTSGVCGGVTRDCSSQTECTLGYCDENLDQCLYESIADEEPPNTTKIYGLPFHTNETYNWINSSTLINLSSTDDESCPSGVNRTYYRTTLMDDSYCEECNGTGGRGDFIEYTNSFTIAEQSCHLIEYYSIDNFDNEEELNWQCVFVDNLPPIPNKTVGEPKTECQEEECEWKITILTPIILDCVDPQPHPVDYETLYYRYYLDGELEQNWTFVEDLPFTLYFPEESNHTLEFYCVDSLGNTGLTDIEKFKVEGTVFTIHLYKKWNLISIPFVLLDDDPEEVFKDIKDKVLSVWTWNGTDWFVWTSDGPNSLENIKPGWGYWVLANDSVDLVIGGSLFNPQVTPPSRVLTPGWNLIGYYGTNWQEYSDDYGDCEDNYEYGNYAYCALNSLVDAQEGFPRWSSLISYVNCGNDSYWVSLDICDNMHAGKGYWIGMGISDTYVPSTTCVWNENFICP